MHSTRTLLLLTLVHLLSAATLYGYRRAATGVAASPRAYLRHVRARHGERLTTTGYRLH